MKRETKIAKLVFAVFVLLSFLVINLLLYMGLTRRLSNNFSGTSQIKMIDVSKYLPHEKSSALARVETSFNIEGELPVLDGAAALVPVYASVIDSVYPRGSVKYEGGEFSDDNYYGENFAADSKMQYKNTVRGYRAIVDGDTDVFFSAYPSEAQLEYAAEQGVELEFVPIGREAFVFFVNKKNPIDSLTAEQIKAIYSGEITSWSEVGGASRVINPVTRIEGSGSQTTMEHFMGDVDFGTKSPLAILGGSIGYTFRFYLEGMVGESDVKMIALDGVYPSDENVKNGKYPLVSNFYAVYRKDNDNENVKLLVEWILSEEGQHLIESVGYAGIK